MSERTGSSESRPNIVIVYLDDLGYGDVGCYGSPWGHTPNIDALAASGIRFTDWYSNSPVCSPSRASLMTGRYPARAGVREILGGSRAQTKGLGEGQVTLASALEVAGYRTALLGKWHLGTTGDSLPTRRGFDEFFGFLAGCVDYYSHIFYWGMRGGQEGVHDLWENETEVWHNGRYLTEMITERAVQFIERSAPDPFMLCLAYNAPHYPLHAPERYLDRFRGLPQDTRIMAAMIAAVDDGVGAVVKALKRRGLYDNTLIFFSSDNGPSNEHSNWLNGREDPFTGSSAGRFRGHKASLFEGGIRMPAIASWPSRIPGGQVSAEVGIMMDVFPTCLHAAGVDPSLYDTDGRSILGVMTGGDRSPHKEVFWEYNGQVALRRGKWKLVINGRDDFRGKPSETVHLADLQEDPAEQSNAKDAVTNLCGDMEAAARDWYAGLGA